MPTLANRAIFVITNVITLRERRNCFMATAVKITTIGNSVGIVLPKEVLAKLNVEKGDSLYLIDTPEGIQLTPYDQDFANEMEAARRVMRKHRDVLRKLAE
jgi:putative addiction module antidote